MWRPQQLVWMSALAAVLFVGVERGAWRSPVAWADEIEGYCVANCGDDGGSSSGESDTSWSSGGESGSSSSSSSGSASGGWSGGGGSGWGWTTSPSPPPAPSAEELEAQRQAALKQAAYDANNRGNWHYQQGQWDQAVAAYQEALQDSPYDPTIQQNFTNALQQQQWAAEQRRREEQWAAEQRRIEEERREAEERRRRAFEAAGAKARQAASDLAAQLGHRPNAAGTGSLQFVGTGPAAGLLMDASVVDLRDAVSSTVEPATVKSTDAAMGRPLAFRKTLRTTEPPAPQVTEDPVPIAGVLIARHSSWQGLDEAALATELATQIRQHPDTVQATLDQLHTEDRDDVAYELLTRTPPESLKALEKDPGTKPLLQRLVDELNSGVVTDEEATLVQQVIHHTSATHGHLMSEAFAPEVQAALQNAGATVQPISGGSGPLNVDEYSVVIERMPDGLTPETLLANLLKDPNRTVNHAAFSRMTEFSRRVQTGEPQLGEIYEIDIIGPDNGDVVLSEKSESHFTFTTIHTGLSGHGEHPEYGNREFGFERNPDGSVTFYTRGATRHALLSRAGAPVAETAMQDTWETFITGIGNVVQSGPNGALREQPLSVHHDPFRR